MRTSHRSVQKNTPYAVLSPDDPVFYNNRGIDYGEKGEYNLTIKDFTKAIELKPDYAFTDNNRAAVYRSKRGFYCLQ